MLGLVIFCVIAIFLLYIQVFTQGLFGTFLMAVLSLTAAAVAFNYYELLAAIINDQGLGWLGSYGASLLGIFVITLLILRLLSDRLIRGNMIFPVPISL